MIRTFSETVVSIGASTELMVLIKATLILVLGLVAVSIARSERASIRHLVLTATFGALLLLPLATVVGPTLSFEIPTARPEQSYVVPASLQVSTEESSRLNRDVSASGSSRVTSRELSANTILLTVWFVGAAIFLASLAAAVWRLRRVRQSAIPWLQGQALLNTLTNNAGRLKPVSVLLHDGIAVPVTSGFLRPAILLPADAREWMESDVQRAFVHELEHIRRGDWVVHLMARLVCAAYWFHPLVWVAWRKLSLEAERSCDDAVLMAGERADYAEQLVAMARRLSSALAPPVLSMANRSDLSRRVSAILDRNQKRGRVGLFYASASLLAATLAVMALAPVRAVGVVEGKDASVSPQKRTGTVANALGRALLEAAESGDVEGMIKLIDAGADVNATVAGDGSALIIAAREGNARAVGVLLERGADPNLGVPGDGNPIIMAAREGHVDLVGVLLDRGASIDQVVPGDENALIQASGEGRLNVVKLLLSRGANINIRVWVDHTTREGGGEWRTPLSVAQKGGHKEVVDYLISMGAKN